MTHGAVASSGLGEDVTEAVLADWRSAPVAEPLRAALGFLEKLTRDPRAVGADDAARLRSAGVTDEAIVDALYVCVLFSLVDRLADAFGFEVEVS